MPLRSLFGYWDTKETVLTHPGEVSSAKAALANGPKGTIGRGMEAGSIVAKIRGRRVVVALFTPSNRSGYGPLFDGILLEQPWVRGVARKISMDLPSDDLFRDGTSWCGNRFSRGTVHRRLP